MIHPSSDVGMTAGPVAPVWHRYGDEESSDVIFLAGRDEDNWRLPAHKDFLSHQNPVFQAMFSDNFSQACRLDNLGRQIVDIPDVDGRSCDNLLRFLYGEPVPLQSLETTLGTLYAADKYICPKLGEVCINELLDKISASNALSVFKFIRIYCHYPDAEITMDFEASAPNALDTENQDLHQKLLNELYQKCMTIIDESAMTVLANEEVEDLDLATVKFILDRPTLNISNELLPFSVLQRWADKECKRQQLPLRCNSKRELLGDAIYSCRYLTLRESDFECEGGPAGSGILTNDLIYACRKVFEMQRNSNNGDVHSTSLKAVDSDSINTLIEATKAFFPSESKPFLPVLLTPRRPLRKDKVRERKEKNYERTRSLCTKVKKWFCQRSLQTPKSSPVHSMKSSPIRTPRHHNHGKHNGDSHCGHSVSSPLKTRKSRTGLDATLQRAIICWAFFFD